MSDSAEVKRFLDTVGLCRRAGFLITGFDAVKADLPKAAGIFAAADISEKTLKEMRFFAEKLGRQVVVVPAEKAEFSQVTGKPTAIISVTDLGFAKTLRSIFK